MKAILTLALFLSLYGFPFSSFAAPPNVIIFLVDDLGYGDIACHGNPHVKTPQIDAFAREATELTQFHVSPVCAPTRASLMTGRYNFRTGVTTVFGAASQMDSSEVTVAERLRSEGYATGIFGKWHLGEEAGRTPNDQGFDKSLSFNGAAIHQYFDPELLHNGKAEKRTGYCMDVFTDAAIDFVKQHREKPFFVYLPANLIHTPLQVGAKLMAEYGALDDSTKKIYGSIRSVDNNFGRLRAALKELGLEDNTLLVFTSDNGPQLTSLQKDRYTAGLHGLKGTVYEGGLRVPCYMRWPAGFQSPTKVTRLAAHTDVLPTVLEACGVAATAEPKLDGISLLPLLKNPAAGWPERTLYFQWDSGQTPRKGQAFTALTEKWKLVQPCGMDAKLHRNTRSEYAACARLQGLGERNIDGPVRYELYAVATDPGETKDLAADQPEVVTKLKAQYEAWFDDVTARWASTTPEKPRRKKGKP